MPRLRLAPSPSVGGKSLASFPLLAILSPQPHICDILFEREKDLSHHIRDSISNGEMNAKNMRGDLLTPSEGYPQARCMIDQDSVTHEPSAAGIYLSPPKPDPVVTATGNQPHVHLVSFPRPQAVERGPADGVAAQLRVLDESSVPLVVWLVLQNTHAAVARSACEHQT